MQCTHHLFSLGCLYSDIFDSCYDILRYIAYDSYMTIDEHGFITILKRNFQTVFLGCYKLVSEPWFEGFGRTSECV